MRFDSSIVGMLFIYLFFDITNRIHINLLLTNAILKIEFKKYGNLFNKHFDFESLSNYTNLIKEFKKF